MAVGTPNFSEAVDRAVERAEALGSDLGDLSRKVRASRPDELNSARQMRERREFLNSLYDEGREADQAYERIIGNNELQDASYLARGALVSRPVMRIVLRNSGGGIRGYGTGFLVGDRVLLTNNHVLQNSDQARNAEAEAYYERGLIGEEVGTRSFALEPEALFYTSEPLDFTLVGVAERDRTGSAELQDLGWLPLIGITGKVLEGEWLTILQHPKGERKQLCVRENQLLKCDNDVLWYSTDTLGGSSGSPVFNNDWLVVALHHSGVPETKDGKWQTVDGRDYDRFRDGEDHIQWKANEGIRVSRIIQTLRTDSVGANHRLVKPMLEMTFGDVRARLPVMFREEYQPRAVFPSITPDMLGRRRKAVPASPAPNPPGPVPPPEESKMSPRRVTLTLEIDEEGGVQLVSSGAAEADLLEEARRSRPQLEIDAPVEPARDWKNGYDPKFLGDRFVVDLPTVLNVQPPPAQPAKAGPLDRFIAPLIRKPLYGQPTPSGPRAASGVLNYNGYSVVMNGARRVAFFSAANINGGVEFKNLKRKDNWQYDDRIDRDHQIGNSFYARNKIDRGHLTRREDMEWGTDPVDATRRANGTCTWTNCAPQHEFFNQDRHPDRAIRLWGGLEKYILEQTARHHEFKVQCFTGPIFGEFDPEYRGVRIPLDYWKVVVAIDALGELSATGYILAQRDVMDIATLDEAALEVPFGKFQTYQRTIEEIEEATGLEFTIGNGAGRLRNMDPIAREKKRPVWKRRHRGRGAGLHESSEAAGVRDEDSPLESYQDVFLGEV